MSDECRQALNLQGAIVHWCRLRSGHEGMHEAGWMGELPTGIDQNTVRWTSLRNVVSITIVPAIEVVARG